MKHNRIGILIACVVLACSFSLAAQVPSTQSIDNKEDAKQKFERTRKAAEQGSASAQFNLGVIYAKGEGVAKDAATVYMWFNLAAANGVEEAAKLRDDLEKVLTPSQVEEGQRMAREWLAQHGQGKVE